MSDEAKYAIIMTLIGVVISIGFLIYEIIIKGNSVIFWSILLTCNIIIAPRTTSTKFL